MHPSHSEAVHCYRCETGGSRSLQRPISASFCCLETLPLRLQIKLLRSISYIHSLKYQKKLEANNLLKRAKNQNLHIVIHLQIVITRSKERVWKRETRQRHVLFRASFVP